MNTLDCLKFLIRKFDKSKAIIACWYSRTKLDELLIIWKLTKSQEDKIYNNLKLRYDELNAPFNAIKRW